MLARPTRASFELGGFGGLLRSQRISAFQLNLSPKKKGCFCHLKSLDSNDILSVLYMMKLDGSREFHHVQYAQNPMYESTLLYGDENVNYPFFVGGHICTWEC